MVTKPMNFSLAHDVNFMPNENTISHRWRERARQTSGTISYNQTWTSQRTRPAGENFRNLDTTSFPPTPNVAREGACAPQITEQILCKRGWVCNFLLVKLHTQGGKYVSERKTRPDHRKFPWHW